MRKTLGRRKEDQIKHLELVTVISEMKEAMDGRFDTMDKKISPMIEAYQAAIKLGAWAKYLLWFLGAAVGLFLAIKQAFKK